LTTRLPLFVLVGILSACYWIARLRIRTAERADGAPTPALMRAIALIDLAALIAIGAASRLFRWPLFGALHLWRHDPASALLIGALAGFALNIAGGGSPLAIAGLMGQTSPAQKHARHAIDQATILLFFAGELAGLAIWFGTVLGQLLRAIFRLIALAIVATGFGVRRAAAGQDHPLLGAVDGLLLGLLAVLSGSVLSVLVAHEASDLFAYVRVASEIEDAGVAGETYGSGKPG
jgi:hypothetical protein